MEAKQGLTVNMDLIIPMYMLAEFQALEFYPNMLGQLELALYVQSKYAVWAVIDPRKVADVKNFFEDQQVGVRWTDIEKVGGTGIPISRKFAQINNPLNCITHFQIDGEDPDNEQHVPTWEASLTVEPRRLLCSGCRVLEMISNISGFRATQRTLESLRELYRNPWRIPAEYLEYYAFPSPPTQNGLHTSTQVNLHNVKDIYVMFPRQANDYTVFENPMIDNFYIKVLGQQYPERTYDTLSPRFYQNMIMACDLDGGLKPTKDFIDTYTMRKNHSNDGTAKDHGQRYNNTLRDNTNFALVIQTERNQSGYVFDGIDSQGQSVPFEIHFNPLFQQDDTYYNYDGLTSNAHPPPPQIWLCVDTYWTADIVNGLVWHKGDGQLPADLDTDEIQ
jgi:hypothetical protein